MLQRTSDKLFCVNAQKCLQMTKLRFSIQKLKKSPLFKDSFWALLGSVLGKGLSLLAGILVARFLGKELYGQYGLIKNTLINISVFSTLGLGYTGTRYIAKVFDDNKGEIKRIIQIIYRITLIASAVIGMAVLIFSKQLAAFLKAPEIDGALRITSLIVLINAINTSQIGILSGFKAFKEIAKNNTYAGVVTFVFSAMLTYYFGFYGALIALLISMVFNAGINYYSTNKFLKGIVAEPETNHSTITSKEIISFSIPIAMQESMYTIVHLIGSYLMIFYGGYGELGITSAASQWAMVILFIPGVLKNVMLSHFSSTESVVLLRKRMILINLVATIIPWLVITVLSKFIAGFYGNTYTNIHIVLSISCFSSIASSISTVIIYEYISRGKNWEMFFVRFSRDAITLLLSWWGLSHINKFQASIIYPTIAAIVGFLFMLFLLFSVRKLDNR